MVRPFGKLRTHHQRILRDFAIVLGHGTAAMGRDMNQDISAFQDFREIATLPIAAGLAALAVTWVVWYFTGSRCSEELATTTGCNASAVAAFINPGLLKDSITNSAIAATGGGIWSYIMITRERRAREAAEQALARERERAEERVEEERRRAEERVEEERRRAEEERTRLLAEIERLTRQLESQQNGTPENST